MPIVEGIISKIIPVIIKESASKGWKSIALQDRVLKVLDKVGLKSKTPDSNFESVYAHTLVNYGTNKPIPVLLEFFRHEVIQNVFRKKIGVMS